MNINEDQKSLRANRKSRKQENWHSSFYGGQKSYGTSHNEYRKMNQRFYEENAEALAEAKEEREQIKANAKVTNAKISTGVGMKWNMLQENACPICTRPLERNKKRKMFYCDIHAGKPFYISEARLKELNEKRHKRFIK